MKNNQKPNNNDNVESIYPLSPMQQGMLFHTLFEPASGLYFQQLTCTLEGHLNISALEQAWQRVVERHSVLRTVFLWEKRKKPLQVVCKTVNVPWTHHDWRSLSTIVQQDRLEALLQSDRNQGFELNQAPLMRCALIRMAEEKYQFIWSHHHLLIDGWSLSNLIQEVFGCYSAFQKNDDFPLKTPRPYREYITWLQKQDREKGELFWRQQLQGKSAPTPFNVDKSLSERQQLNPLYLEQEISLSSSTTAALNSFARQHQLTLNNLVQAAWALLLSRYSGEDDVVYGVTVSGRPPQLAGVESMVGLFINTLPLRISLTAETTLLPWLKGLQAKQVECEQYSYTPLVEIQGWSEIPRGTSLFESLLVFENYPVDASFEKPAGGLKISQVQSREQTNYPLTVVAAPGLQIYLKISYDTNRFENETITRMLGHFQSLLEGIVANPEQRISEIQILTKVEKEQLLSGGNQRRINYPQEQCIHQLFEEQVAKNPEAIAVVFEGQQLTYQELNQRANQLAHYLQKLGVKTEDLVGLCVERSLEMIVGIFGILKAGGAYVPLDPNYPPERLSFLLADTNLEVLLSQKGLLENLPPHLGKVVCLDTDWPQIQEESSVNLSHHLGAENLAYVIYTSGSTGQPKGVLINHGNVLRLLSATEQWFHFGTGDVWTMFHSFAFDFSVWEMWGALAYGGRLVIVPYWVSRSPADFYELLCREKVTVLNQTPSAFLSLINFENRKNMTDNLTLRWVIFGGEALELNSLKPWFESHGDTSPRLVNMYGITETTVHVTYRPIMMRDLRENKGSVIGCPIEDLQVYVLDPNLQPVPIGVPGELYIGGAGVARGYWNRPELTAERFIPHPFEENTQAILYRSGDLVRYLSNGELEYLCRIDNQVKIRGFRLELGEIEAALNQYSAVAQTVVIAREDTPGDKRLVGYIVTQEQSSVSISELREFLKQKLPEYMLPSAFVFLPALPLNTNGKIDRQSLPAPDLEPQLEVSFVSPRHPIEEILCQIWAEVLGLERVGINDNFFELGGHSLLATQLISRVRNIFQLELPLRSLFENSTIAKLATYIQQCQQDLPLSNLPPLQTRDRDGKLSLSFAQQRLWFFDQLEPNTTAYNIFFAVQIQGLLQVTALEQSLSEIIRRHEILRTNFQAEDGQPVQIIHPVTSNYITVIDQQSLSVSEREQETQRLVTAEAQQPFNLATEPLLRVRLLVLSEMEHILLVCMHHIISDGWSMGVFIHEITTLYTTFSQSQPLLLPELPIQYVDFALWQRQWLQGEVLDSQVAYWQQQLKDAPTLLKLPTDRPRPAVQTFRGAYQSFILPQDLTASLKSLSRREEVTLFMTLLAAFDTLLYRYTGQTDILVGSPIANRNRREIEGLIGFFVNTLVLRTDLSSNPSFQDLLKQVREVALEAYAHQDLPFETLVETLKPERSLSHSPLFQVMFILQNTPISEIKLTDLNINSLVVPSLTSNFDLTLSYEQTSDGLVGLWEYNTDLFEEETITRMHAHLQTILEEIVANPKQRISEMPILTKVEKEQLLWVWNQPQTNSTREQCIHQLFEEQVEKTPNAIAVVFEGQQLTYQELNQRANQLAHYLQKLGVKNEALVGICLERSLEMIVGIFGILKAGGAYVPLDPNYPPERLIHILKDCQLPFLLTTENLVNHLPKNSTSLICLDSNCSEIEEYSIHNPLTTVPLENLAYVIYTSGSTGTPKGVIISHQSLVNAYEGWEQAYHLSTRTSSHLQMANFAFDVFTGDLVRALCSGGQLVLCPKESLLIPEKLYQLMREQAVNCAEFVPAVIRNLREYLEATQQNLDFMKVLIVGSDSWLVKEYEQLEKLCSSETHLINSYGVTEACIDSCYFEGTALDLSGEALVPIGRPFVNTNLYILDSNLQLVPVGVPGELCIEGVGLARGYLNAPELTKGKFIVNPFSHNPQSRLYRTGDLVRYLPDGNIEYLGRIDNQVKIRGFRIELTEIEAALIQHMEVKEAVVIDREDIAKDKRLVAYIATHEQSTPSISELREFLKQKLPEYMLPSAFVFLEALPLNTNGKIDRQSLPAPELERQLEVSFVSPRNPIEEMLCQIWAEVLGLERVGINDNFFELGGHSLLATQLISRVRDIFQLDLPLRILFQSATIAEFALYVEQQQNEEIQQIIVPLQKMPREGKLALSFAQQRLWFLAQLEPNSAFYNMPGAVRLQGQLQVPILERSLREIIRRHEALRTNFITENGQPVQIIYSANAWNLEVINLEHLPISERERESERLATAEAQKPFNLATEPLLRVSLLVLSETEYILVFCMHHIISDGWSMGVFVREIASLYSAFSQGQPSPLPELPIQYVDFALWQRQWLQGEVLDSQLAYWQKQLKDVPALLELPTDRPRPPVQSFRGTHQFVTIPGELTESLNLLSQQEGVTLFMTLLAAFDVLLYRYTGQTDILVGSGIANRNRSEIEDLIGFFVNALVLRTDMSGNPSFKELLTKVKEITLTAYAHQDLPFEMLVEELQPERNLSHAPLFQVAFVFQNTPMPEMELPGLNLSFLPADSKTTKFDLTLSVDEIGNELLGLWEYNTDLFDDETITRIARHFQTLLEGIVTNREQPISQLPLLTSGEKHQLLVEWNNNQLIAPCQSQCIHQLFERRVVLHSEAVAVVFDNQKLTYGELNSHANQLAHYLITLGVKEEVLVGICIERSLAMIIGILGILKAGGAYLPLDPDYPQQRLSFLLADTQVPLLLTQQHLVTILPEYQGVVICLDEVEEKISQYSPENPINQVTGTGLANVIYTSGSTGIPKGVMVTHAGICNLAQAQIETFKLVRESRVLQFASLNFDASTSEIFMALTSGASLYLATKDSLLPGDGFIQMLKNYKISHLTLPPSVLAVMPRTDLPSLQTLIVAGEACSIELMKQWSVGRSFFNAYGPTEATVCTTIAECKTEDNQLSIGRPIINTKVYILDSYLQPVPVGVAGELYIEGVGLARGYLNRHELTKEKFIVNPFNNNPQSRLYQTGDLVRYLPDGNIEYLGRIDNQVKIRGFRIELGEIEAALYQHQEVQETVVIVREDQPQDQRLVAYVVANQNDQGLQSQIDQWQNEHLSDWQNLYERDYQQIPTDQDLTFNITGWNSSYTGLPIPTEEMCEWVDNTVQQILELQPKRVLEIGCGSGLLLSRIAPHCNQYWATDYAQSALQYIEAMKSPVNRLENITLLQRVADDFRGIETEVFDTVIINSVVQYFPSISYLLRVLEQAVNVVKSKGCIFIGDVRDLLLLEAYHTSVQLYQASDSVTLKQLKQRVQQRLIQEEELLIDPAFFVALKQHLPQISDVQVQPKRGTYKNELIKFRYDVILYLNSENKHLDSQDYLEKSSENLIDSSKIKHLNWQKQPLDLGNIRQCLMRENLEVLAITNIANSRVETEIQAWELLHNSTEIDTIHELRQKLSQFSYSGIDPEDLWKLGQDLPYNIKINCSNSHTDGAYAVIFKLSSVPKFKDFLDKKTSLRPWNVYANNPLQGKLTKKLIPQLRKFLEVKLPNYMLPSAFMLLESMPLTANGKIDRSRLPTPEMVRSELEVGFVAPRNSIEEMLALIWAEVLGLERIGIYDNFFELGGHSLLGTQLISRVQNIFKVQLPLRSLFESGTVADLAQSIQRLEREETETTKLTVQPTSREGQLPLSFAQQRLWFLNQLDPNSVAYNIPAAVKLEGQLNINVLAASLKEIIRRHEALRTNFITENGQPVQKINQADDWQMSILDWTNRPVKATQTEIEQIARAEAQKPFNLETDPLVRATLVQLSETEHLLLLTMHHIVSDGWSMGLFVQEIAALYPALCQGKPSPLEELSIQYADFAQWQRQWLQGEIKEVQLAYWQKQLGNAPTLLELPTDRPRPAVQSFSGAHQVSRLPRELSQALNSLGQKEGSTLFMTLLAAFKTLLYRYTGQTDILVGSPIANRNHRQIESLIGFFVNTLVLRTDLGKNPSFLEVLQQVREVALEAYAHQDMPFEMLVEALQPERNLSHTPLFQVMFALQNTPTSEIELLGLNLSRLAVESSASAFDLSVSIDSSEGELIVSWEYNTDLFNEGTITRLGEHFQTLLEGIVANPQERVSQLPLMKTSEREQLLYQWNDTYTNYPQEQCIHQLFEEQVAKNPEAIAVVFEGQQLTYQELNQRANQLAHYLQKSGVKTEDLVGICVERSLEMIVGIFGILKAGGAYVPLDPNYPPERLSFLLADTQVSVLLSQQGLLENLPPHTGQVVCLDTDWAKIELESSLNLSHNISAENLAYVIYTSGSTGQPKGVAVTHRAINRLVLNTNYIHLTSEDHIAQAANFAFDAATFEIWGALLNGARVVIIAQDVVLSPEQFAENLRSQRISVLFLTTALFNNLARFVPQAFSSLRALLFGGEAVDPRWVREVLNQGAPQQLLHVYGPTENTTFSSWYLVENLPITATTVPIGRPIANTQIYLLDQNLNPVPIGVPGELYLGGDGLAQGYLNRLELTAEKFIPHPFSQKAGVTLYKTGDLAQYLDDGSIKYLRRIDNQIKIRGFRIELGEIETVLSQHPSVLQTIVIAREDIQDNKRLVAYLLLYQQETPTLAELRHFLMQKLPEYMLPSAFVFLESLPLTANGKIDYHRLPAPEFRTQLEGDFVAPRNSIEEILAEIWTDVLGIEKIGIYDNFFILGGHSLLATQLMVRLCETFSVELPLRCLFENSTIAELSEVILAQIMEQTQNNLLEEILIEIDDLSMP